MALVCLIYAWPCAYLIARHGGRYRLLLVLLTAAPFLTGILLRITAMQQILGPIGLVNMALPSFGLAPVQALMYTNLASAIGLIYLWIPFMLVAVYLSLLNFNFELLEVAKVCGARPWRAFWAITWPLNWMGTAIGIVLVVVPTLAATVTPRFLGGPNGALYGNILEHQFGATGTWALGSAMGVVLFLVSLALIGLIWQTDQPAARRLHRRAGRLRWRRSGPGGRSGDPGAGAAPGAALRFPLFSHRLHRVSLVDGEQRLAVSADLDAGVVPAPPDHERRPHGPAQQPPDRARHRDAGGAARDRGRSRHPALPGAPPRPAGRLLHSAVVRRRALIGISTLMFNRNVLGLPGNIPSAILANATYGLSFAFLVILAQLVRYDWRLDEAAMVFGARPMRTFWEVTLPSIWPAVLGAFLVSFILGFNNFEVSFYNLGAVPTLPTVAWGTLRHGIEPELYALATLVNLAVFALLLVLYLLLRTGLLRLGVPED